MQVGITWDSNLQAALVAATVALLASVVQEVGRRARLRRALRIGVIVECNFWLRILPKVRQQMRADLAHTLGITTEAHDRFLSHADLFTVAEVEAVQGSLFASRVAIELSALQAQIVLGGSKLSDASLTEMAKAAESAAGVAVAVIQVLLKRFWVRPKLALKLPDLVAQERELRNLRDKPVTTGSATKPISEHSGAAL